MGLSLRDLAERSGVSAPMLSQVERGETSPTLSVAARIAGGLDLSLSQLLRLDEGGAVTVVRAGERARGRRRSRGHSYEVLTPPLPGQRAEVSLPRPRRRAPRPAGAGRPADARAGRARDRRRARGRAAPALRRRRRTTSARATRVTFDSDLPHRFENPGKAPTRFLAVVTAGLRRS